MSERLPHYVSDAPFEIVDEDELTPEQERFFLASQWKMMLNIDDELSNPFESHYELICHVSTLWL